MSKIYKKFFVKVLLLSAFLTVILNIWDNYLNANWIDEIDNLIDNNITFKKINKWTLWKTWVAITTNIWIRYKQRKEITSTIYKEIFSINEIINNENTANKEIIWNNMIYIEEYRNILKSNIKQLLNTSYDKSRILNAFIQQLEYRYTLATENQNILNKQKLIFDTNMIKSDADVEILKAKIELDFTNNNSNWSLENINTYLELKKDYYYAKTYITYINHFLYEYKYLNEYNKKLLDILILNKDALIKDSYVVIPDTWVELLRNFNLIYSEEEFKK